jgi:(2Fe-2S) ferredoxin
MAGKEARRVLVCQGITCRKYNSKKVLAVFQADPVPGVEVIGSSCLGQCGNGPMVLVEPEQIWYEQVHPEQVAILIDRHLRGQCPVTSMLYRKFYYRDLPRSES